MENMRLNYFTNDDSFPFFIQYGAHENTMFIHDHEDFSELVVVMDGTAEHIVESERFPIKKGDVFVLGSGIQHGYGIQPKLVGRSTERGLRFPTFQSSGFREMYGNRRRS